MAIPITVLAAPIALGILAGHLYDEITTGFGLVPEEGRQVTTTRHRRRAMPHVSETEEADDTPEGTTPPDDGPTTPISPSGGTHEQPSENGADAGGGILLQACQARAGNRRNEGKLTMSALAPTCDFKSDPSPYASKETSTDPCAQLKVRQVENIGDLLASGASTSCSAGERMCEPSLVTDRFRGVMQMHGGALSGQSFHCPPIVCQPPE
jgi:hypothetical protein